MLARAPTLPLAWRGECSESQRAALAFLFIAALALLVQFQRDVEYFPYDSALYSKMAIDPSALPSDFFIRGYLYPFVMGCVVKALAWLEIPALTCFRIFSALLCASVLTWVLPATYNLLYQGRTGMLRRIGLALVVTSIYPGFLLYPLSELPAVGLIWLAVYCLLRARPETASARPLAGWLFLSGCAAAAAYNTRTIYLFSLPLVLLAAWLFFAGRRIHLAWFVAGAILVSLPQVVVNYRVHGKVSANPTVAFGERSLFASQLWLGVRVQKYESSLAAGTSSFQYADPAGLQLFARLQQEGPVTTVRDYLAAVARHPLEFAGLYGRHLLNGLDVRDGRVYLLKPSTDRIGASFLCISALLLALFAIATRQRPAAATPTDRRHWLLTGALVLPGLLVVPGQMETRFMVPALAYLYAAALAHAWWPGMRARLKARWHVDLTTALVAYAVFFGITQSSIAHIQPPPVSGQAQSVL